MYISVANLRIMCDSMGHIVVTAMSGMYSYANASVPTETAKHYMSLQPNNILNLLQLRTYCNIRQTYI